MVGGGISAGAYIAATGGAFGAEQPSKQDADHVVMYDLPEWQRLQKEHGARCTDLHQCPYGAETAKPTSIMSLRWDSTPLVRWCDHPKQWVWEPLSASSGYWVWSAHDRKVQQKSAEGGWATADQSAYPTDLNRALAQQLAAEDCARGMGRMQG